MIDDTMMEGLWDAARADMNAVRTRLGHPHRLGADWQVHAWLLAEGYTGDQWSQGARWLCEEDEGGYSVVSLWEDADGERDIVAESYSPTWAGILPLVEATLAGLPTVPAPVEFPTPMRRMRVRGVRHDDI